MNGCFKNTERFVEYLIKDISIVCNEKHNDDYTSSDDSECMEFSSDPYESMTPINGFAISDALVNALKHL